MGGVGPFGFAIVLQSTVSCRQSPGEGSILLYPPHKKEHGLRLFVATLQDVPLQVVISVDSQNLDEICQNAVLRQGLEVSGMVLGENGQWLEADRVVWRGKQHGLS